MISKIISVILVAVLLHGSIAAQGQPQSPSSTVARMQQVLHKAQKKDKVVKVTLIDKQRTFSGKVTDISDTSFVLTDQKTGTTTKLAYADVREVHQKGMTKGVKIGIIVAVTVGVIVGLAFALKPDVTLPSI